MRGTFAPLALIMVAACTSPTKKPTEPTPSDPSVVPSGAHPPVVVLQEQVCARAYACRDSFDDSGDVAFDESYGDDDVECEVFDVHFNEDAEQEFATSVAAHRVHYDPAALERCLHGRDVAPVPCEQFFTTCFDDQRDACKEALVGTVADDGACSSEWDCQVEGSVCVDGTCFDRAGYDAHKAAGDAAMSHYVSGRRAYDLGRFDEAIAEWEAAYAAKPDTSFLFNIGQAHRQAGRCAEARAAFQRFIDAVTDSTQKAKGKEMLAELGDC
jgi:hypothetical protein